MATPLPPINAGGGKSASALEAQGSLFQASGDGDWVVNMGGSGGSGFGGFGGFGGGASSGALGSVAGGMSPLLLLAILGAAWYMLKR